MPLCPSGAPIASEQRLTISPTLIGKVTLEMSNVQLSVKACSTQPCYNTVAARTHS